jgi:hypothetical protein
MNIWTGLLFLEGAIADPRLARELAAADSAAAAIPGSAAAVCEAPTAAGSLPAGSISGAVPT